MADPSSDGDTDTLIRRLYVTIGVLAAVVVGLAIALGIALADSDGGSSGPTVEGGPEPVEAEEFTIVVDNCDDTGASGMLTNGVGDEAQVALAVDFLDGDRKLFSGRLRLRLDGEATVPWNVPYDPEVVGEAAAGIVPTCDVYVQEANVAE